MKLNRIAIAAVLLLAPAAVLAQTATPPAATSVPSNPATTPATPTPRRHDYNINQRKNSQQQRIANGVQNGTLKPSQTSRLEHQEAGINKEERGMRAQDNGKLTKQDRKTLHQQQNQESRRIYRDKHTHKS